MSMYQAAIERIRNQKQIILQEMSKTKEMASNYIKIREKKMIDISNQYHEEESKFSKEMSTLQEQKQSNADNFKNLQIEQQIISNQISIQEKENEKMEDFVLKMLPNEFSKYEFLYKKENEMHQKMKLEITNQKDQLSNEILIREIQSTIDLFKELSGISIEKTKENLLKINLFKNNDIPQNENEFYIILGISQGKFKIFEVRPKFNYLNYETELNKCNNLTLFLSQIIINEFSKYFNQK